MRKKSVYVTYGHTESGDDLQPLVWWGAKPTDEEINEVYKKLMRQEFDEVGFVHHNTVKASIQ